MIQDANFIYSSHSIKALKELINQFFEDFNIFGITADDLFYYGVFCKTSTYANYPDWNKIIADGITVPEILSNRCSKEKERMEFVEEVIGAVMTCEIEKPQWMTAVEENVVCNSLNQPPSTYLRLIPKEDEYKILADKIIDFLYSVNLIVKFIKCDED